MQDVLHNAAVAVVPDAQHFDAAGAGVGDIHIGAFLRIQAAAHADVTDIRAALDHAFAHAGGVAQKHGIGISDALHDLVIAGRDIAVQRHFFCVLMQRFLGGRNQAYRLNDHQFVEHQ